mmetsp:Transcript_7740/g.17690  ORF Transcript_7740/g.17690 Transcript_7740/m.17690 type:complete len:205 (+) Transcript_7740:640-1254(+)
MSTGACWSFPSPPSLQSWDARDSLRTLSTIPSGWALGALGTNLAAHAHLSSSPFRSLLSLLALIANRSHRPSRTHRPKISPGAWIARHTTRTDRTWSAQKSLGLFLCTIHLLAHVGQSTQAELLFLCLLCHSLLPVGGALLQLLQVHLEFLHQVSQLVDVIAGVFLGYFRQKRCAVLAPAVRYRDEPHHRRHHKRCRQQRQLPP